MDISVIIIIAITCIISYFGFQNISFFEKYKFEVRAIAERKEYIRLISSGFLHGSLMHLVFNMMTLFFFADPVIRNFGRVGFLLIYFGSMILGNLFCLYLYKKIPYYSAIGASGGVSGILFASIAVFPFMGIYIFFIPIAIPGFIFGALYFSYSVYMMLNPNPQDNIGHAAHLGGAAFGFLYAISQKPDVAMSHGLQLGIMALPLLYMSYQVFIKKRIG